MPGKHVRFSTQNTVYPPVPGLSHSVLTDNSSSGLYTPPSYYNVLPGPTHNAPRRSYTDPQAGKARAHNLLAYRSAPLITYDLTLPPSAISTHYHGLSSAGMSEPAVYPPQSTLTITTPHLPWSVVVAASNNRRYVTVADVLSALYHGLRTNITSAEFASLGSEKLMRRVTAAYTARYTRLKGHRGYEHEKASGVKRVDYLMGCTELRGLTPTSRVGVWRLHVA
ncbi:hypothetical protein FB45DRAFT_825022 [Roridomyces roridus]|uniref:DUF6699 domain-containing protein n=1 Tax=Roridomyces roridus TaxID=1738132 RepID=A0AAD7CCT5_9AGAR|nr:hypothetical protein FB45DRAFT_825022 [Roridomyces roridus]